MSDMMTLPDTWEEFEKSYGFTDNEEVYTNGARLIPSFRVKQWLDHLSSEEPQKWIPVSERLPEIGEYVLCSQDNGDVGEGKLLNYGGWHICYDQTCRGSYWVNAWQPLPEPWKEGQDETN